MDTCAPLAPGTLLRTMSGTEFRLLAEHFLRKALDIQFQLSRGIDATYISVHQ